MTHFFRIVLLASFFLKGLVGYSSEFITVDDSVKYLNFSNRSLLSHARKAADNDSYEEAKTLYRLLVNRDSTNALYNYECGVNYFLNLFEQPLSLPYFERALKYSGKDTIEKVFYYLGQAYQLNNRYAEAIHAYTTYKRYIRKNKSELEDVAKKIVQCEQGKGYLATFNNVVNIDNVGTNINSNEAEYVPVVKADESVMYFTARRKSNVGGEKDPESNRFYEDMFISKGDSGLFHVGERFTLGDTLTKKLRNTGAHESVVSLSYDEQILITFKNNSLWWSKWLGSSWDKPARFPKNVNVGQYQNHGSFSAKNDTLYFSSNAKGGYGGLDIYMSIKAADGKWGKAINLGPVINTSEDDDSPSIAFDNGTLYFSSKGHNSMGGYDVYKTVYENGQWSAPLNLGMPINSSGDDIYFKYDKYKKQAYFSSSRQRGFGDYDIYRLINYDTPRFDDCQAMNPLMGFAVSLDAKKTLGPNVASNLEYHWEFSDGENAEGEKVEHTFKEPGRHNVKLYVLDPILHTFVEQKDTTITILNVDKVHFTSADTISIDSLLTFNGAPTKLDNATILKYHWTFSDSTPGSDSSIAQHQFKEPGTYEVKLSMVARDDSTEKVFQKCITKTVNILNKEEYMQYYLKSLERENRKKGFTSEMLARMRLNFLAPDTTTLEIQNEFDASPVFIPKSKILSYKWDFGDTLMRINSKIIKHSYDSIGLYQVKMNVIFQVDSTKGIYEREVMKNITVLDPVEYEKLQLAKQEKERTAKQFASEEIQKRVLDFLAPDTTSLSFMDTYDSKPIYIPNSKIVKYKWTFGDSLSKNSNAALTHSFDSLGVFPVKLDVVYQDKKTKGLYEASVTKNVTVVDPVEFDKLNTLRNQKNAIAAMQSTEEFLNIDFTAPDTTAPRFKNTFSSKPIRRANLQILKYEWQMGDSTRSKLGSTTTHAYINPGAYEVKLEVVYKNTKTNAVHKVTKTKQVAVIDSLSYEQVASKRKMNPKNDIAYVAENNQEAIFDTSGLPQVDLENIYFDYDKFTIRQDAKESLLRNITKLGIDTLLAIKVSANTDSRGSKAYNFKLSAKRAISAINFMAANNIARDRIIAVVSQGETNLVNKCGDNVKCSEKEHQLNRRDEFHVVGRIKK